MTSGPAASVGAPGPARSRKGGMTTDLGAPLDNCVISIACIAAPMEMFPTCTPASEARPSAAANSFEISSRPPWMVSNCALAL